MSHEANMLVTDAGVMLIAAAQWIDIHDPDGSDEMQRDMRAMGGWLLLGAPEGDLPTLSQKWPRTSGAFRALIADGTIRVTS